MVLPTAIIYLHGSSATFLLDIPDQDPVLSDPKCQPLDVAQTFLPSVCFMISMFVLSGPAILEFFQCFERAVRILPSSCFFMLILLPELFLDFFLWPIHLFRICFDTSSSRESCVMHTFSSCPSNLGVRHLPVGFYNSSQRSSYCVFTAALSTPCH